MTRRLLLILMTTLLSAVPSSVSSAPVLACERLGQIVVFRFHGSDPQREADILARLRASGHLPAGPACWRMNDRQLPERSRPDPHAAGQVLSQRHRWRRAGQAVIVDSTVKRPHGEAIRREYGRLFPPVRWAEIVATPLGSALDRAIRENRWADASAALAQTGAAQPLTAAEIAQLQAILRDYEAD